MVYGDKVLLDVTDYTVATDALAIDVKDYIDNYDGEAHGIVVPKGVTMKYGEAAGTYDKDSVTRKNAGTIVVIGRQQMLRARPLQVLF